MPPGFDPSMTSGPDLTLIEMAVYAAVFLIVLLIVLTQMAIATLPVFFAALGVMELGLRVVQNMPDPVGKFSKIGGLVFRNMRRNLLRTALTYVALFVLTGMLTFFYGIIKGIERFTEEKEGAQIVIMTEKFGIPSQMPPGYVRQLKDVIREKLPPEHRPDDVDKHFMTWSFVVGSLDKLLRPIRLVGYVNAAPGFKNAPAVLNGASDLLIRVFGDELGRHARMALYQHELARDAPIAGEIQFALRT